MTHTTSAIEQVSRVSSSEVERLRLEDIVREVLEALVENEQDRGTKITSASVVYLTKFYNSPEAVIPVKTRIQLQGLDSPVSSTGQAYQARNDTYCKAVTVALN